MGNRSIFVPTASLLALATASPAFAQTGVPAQEAPTSADDFGEDIIVTAQKKSESIQDVPIAISAFSSENIDDKAIDDAVDLSFSVPNLTVDQSGASLRGVGNLAISSTAESGLGYHVNGVYLGNAATEQEYFDIERIEVLRGPQGTLYGRNTTAGVINIITQKPTDEFEGYLTAGYGNYETYRVKGAINVPIGENLAARVAGFYLKRDGYTQNIFTGNDIDDRDMFGVRGSARAEFGNTRIDLVFGYFEEDDRRSPLAKGVCTKNAATGCSPLTAGFETPDSRTTIFNALGYAVGLLPRSPTGATQDYFAGAVNPADLRVVNQDLDPTFFVREYNASLEIEHDFGDLTFTSLTGYQKIKRDIFNDFDRFVPTLMLTRPITFDLFANDTSVTTSMIQSGRRDLSNAEQWYQELRLASSFDGPLNFLLGANYYDQSFDILVSITHPTLAAVQQIQGLNAANFETFTIESNPTTTQSYGLFGEAYLDLSDRTRLTGGIRYSHDKKFILTRQIFLDPLPDGSVRPFTQGDFDKGVFTGRVVLDHAFTDDLNGYVSLSRGYKAGGINPGGATVPTFDPEFLNAAELGLKGATSDGTFRANASAFYYDYKDLQIGQVGVTSANTVNTDATVYGAEVEFAVRPAPALQFDGSFSYLHTEIKGFQSGDEGDPNGIAPGTVPVRDASGNIVRTGGGLVLKDLDGNELPFSPPIKIAVGLQYELGLGNGFTLTPRIDHYQQGRFFGTAFNKQSEDFPGYSQTDVKLLLKPDSEGWELRGYIKNLFNSDDVTRITQEGPLVGRFRSLFVLEPRTYGVEATYRF